MSSVGLVLIEAIGRRRGSINDTFSTCSSFDARPGWVENHSGLKLHREIVPSGRGQFVAGGRRRARDRSDISIRVSGPVTEPTRAFLPELAGADVPAVFQGVRA